MTKRFGLMGLETVESEYLDRRGVMNCADETAAGIDEEVMRILKESYKEAKKLLKENRAVMDKIADYLIEKETITGHEFMEIFCKEKGIPMPEKKSKYEEKSRQIFSKKYDEDSDSSSKDSKEETSSSQSEPSKPTTGQNFEAVADEKINIMSFKEVEDTKAPTPTPESETPSSEEPKSDKDKYFSDMLKDRIYKDDENK